jgi:thiamine phosphate synthase YjbQ (UPF0047 family)
MLRQIQTDVVVRTEGRGLYLWEHRKMPHRRRIVIHLIGE